MCDLKDGPHHLVLLFALVCSILCVFHLVLELEKGVFDVVEAVGWGLSIAGCAHWWHFDDPYFAVI